ncbi:hypothetical protein [Butyrivibrio sp. AE2032]|uniref:hypothetical protein n=1 Tax=Butyrivibrio sp. AE2032 TaxID=1458463 RepID=UPI000556B5DD|nr:hypothetical protein [Butyrivibrio sp. AE2032]
MVVGEKITRDGKTYVITDVWGNNFGMREVKEEENVPVFEETPVEEVKEETPKKKVVRRKKA